MSWTHYVVEKPGSVCAFEKGTCEKCCGPVQEPNAVGMSEQDAIKIGLTRIDKILPEIYYSEKLGHTYCEECGETDFSS